MELTALSVCKKLFGKLYQNTNDGVNSQANSIKAIELKHDIYCLLCINIVNSIIISLYLLFIASWIKFGNYIFSMRIDEKSLSSIEKKVYWEHQRFVFFILIKLFRLFKAYELEQLYLVRQTERRRFSKNEYPISCCRLGLCSW